MKNDWKEWSFKVFKKDNGDTMMDEWDIPEDAKAEIDVRISLMKATKKWVRPQFDKLVGHKHIHEIRIKHNRVEYRPLGYFGPHRWFFTLLIGARERDNKLVPKNAASLAEDRRQLIVSDPKRYTDDY